MTGHARTGGPRSLGLHTDLYELRMVETFLREGMTADATFSLYIRPTPERPWFVALGIDRVLDFLDGFGYGPEELVYLRSIGLSDEAIEWLATFEPSGEIWAVADGTVVLAEEPILEVTASLPAAQIIETAVINLVQLSTLVATKAARIALAAAGRPVVDFGFRRAQGLETGVEAARAAFVGGGLATSNLEAGRRYGIDVVGTMAHSFVQAYHSELDAFRAFAADHPENTILLVDTYDSIQGTRNAIVMADELREQGRVLRGVRLDSGDLLELSKQARRLLDDAGHSDTQIFASGGLDEVKIAELLEREAPIDAFGVGTDLVVSMDRPAVDIAYKLVSYDGRPVAKFSSDKETYPGAKQVFRQERLTEDVLALRSEDLAGNRLLAPVWHDGRRLQVRDIGQMRTLVSDQLDALGGELEQPTLPRPSPALAELTQRLRPA